MNHQTEKILIPLLPGCDHVAMLRLAAALSRSQPVCLAGIVPVAAGESLSAGINSVRNLRRLMMGSIGESKNVELVDRVHVTHSPWEYLKEIILKDKIDLMLLSYPNSLHSLALTPAEILSHPPCDIGLVCGPIPEKITSVVVPLQYPAQAEKSIALSQILTGKGQGEMAALSFESTSSELFEQIDGLKQLRQVHATHPNRAEAMIQASRKHDLIILGAAQRPTAVTDSFGVIPDFVLNQAECGVICLKTKERELVAHDNERAVVQQVDRWFAENSFHVNEFEDLNELLALKRAQNVTVSVALPALNEAGTIGDVLEQIQTFLMDEVPLIDELVVIDSDSTDETREIACSYGVPVYIHQQLLTEYGARSGKGEALWKSLYVTTGDIVLWCDTDIKNFDPRFIYGLLGPLLKDSSLQFVKGFYQRPIVGAEGEKKGGGRVTELTARPLLNMFFPELSGFVQPLAGEYGGRRELLEQLTFTSGYGVETSILIDALEKVGLDKLAQVDLVERIHHNQSLENLGKMSFAITQAIFQRLEHKHSRAEFKALNRLLNLSLRRVQQDGEELFLDHQMIVESLRPPMNTVPAYHNRYLTPEMPLTGIKAGNLLRDLLSDPDEIFLIPGRLASRS